MPPDLAAELVTTFRVRDAADPDNGAVPAEEWTTAEHVGRYLGRADEFPRRAEGESVLLDHVSREVRRLLDLGTGDGRLLALLMRDRPRLHAVGPDFSDVMLEAARDRFVGDERIELVQHDMTAPMPPLGRFDAVVSSLAIHHLEDDRKRTRTRGDAARLPPRSRLRGRRLLLEVAGDGAAHRRKAGPSRDKASAPRQVPTA